MLRGEGWGEGRQAAVTAARIGCGKKKRKGDPSLLAVEGSPCFRLVFLVPTLRVGTHSRTLRVPGSEHVIAQPVMLAQGREAREDVSYDATRRN